MGPISCAAVAHLRAVGSRPSAPLVIAHRGASAHAPENTMAAFEAAWSAGAAWVEADVQPTVDGVPVILHDDTVDRTTNGTGTVRELPWARVAGLDAGSWFGGARSFRDEPVPRLTELLGALTPGRGLLLEVKGEHTRAQVAVLLQTLAATGRGGQVLLQSFELPVLRLIREQQPARAVGLLVEELDDDPARTCRELGATAYNPPVAAVLSHPELVDLLHEAEIAVAVWTADTPAEWAALATARVDAIITNRPAQLMGWLAGRS